MESKHGNVQYELWEQVGSSREVLGRLSILQQKDRVVYKVYVPDIGNASVSNCMNPDKLIEWLSLSADVSPERHTELSREVRQSLGMRIRKAT